MDYRKMKEKPKHDKHEHVTKMIDDKKATTEKVYVKSCLGCNGVKMGVIFAFRN